MAVLPLTKPRSGLDQVLARLAELSSPTQLIDQAAPEAAYATGADWAVLSAIHGGHLRAESAWVAGGGEAEGWETRRQLTTAEVPLAYPLVEAEVLRRRRPTVVHRSPGGAHAFAHALDRPTYAVAPLVLEGQVTGFLHVGRDDGSVDESDADYLGQVGLCFAVVFERAMLRQRVRAHQRELRQLGDWMTGMSVSDDDRHMTLHVDMGAEAAAAEARRTRVGPDGLRDLLTRRETDVLELLVRGTSNAGIARELVISEGTVKFHVRNVLRKLRVTNRAEATSLYLRITLERR